MGCTTRSLTLFGSPVVEIQKGVGEEEAWSHYIPQIPGHPETFFSHSIQS